MPSLAATPYMPFALTFVSKGSFLPYFVTIVFILLIMPRGSRAFGFCRPKSVMAPRRAYSCSLFSAALHSILSTLDSANLHRVVSFMPPFNRFSIPVPLMRFSSPPLASCVAGDTLMTYTAALGSPPTALFSSYTVLKFAPKLRRSFCTDRPVESR